MSLSFSHLNLRRNPFGVPEDDAWDELVVADLDDLAGRMRGGVVVQIIGAAGRGKSTHLRGLAGRFPGARVRYVKEGDIPEVAGGVALLDEAQRLPPGWLVSFREPLALATHDDLTGEIGRDVFTVTLSGMDRARLRLILERRIAWARRGSAEIPTFTDATLDRLVARFGDDLRATEHHLYDVFQSLDRVRAI